MKTNQFSLLLLTCLLTLSSPASSRTLKLKVSVSSSLRREAAPVVIKTWKWRWAKSVRVYDNGVEVPAQLDRFRDGDVADELVFLADVGANSHKFYTVILSDEQPAVPQEAHTYAELMLRNPAVKDKNKQDIYLKEIAFDSRTKDPYHVMHHHGVAFENELVALRVYMDKRQTVDLYGKRHKGLELAQTQFYTTAEQKAQGMGDDVLWVGNTFGLGAVRGWDGRQPTMVEPVESRGQRIVTQGPVRTIVEMYDKGWQPQNDGGKVDMRIRYTLYSGHRDIRVDVFFNHRANDYLFSTGFVNVKGSKEFTDNSGLRGCWGSDFATADTVNLKRETVGLGMIAPKGAVAWPTDKDNYAFVFGGKSHLTYHIAFASDNETFGVHRAEDWFDWLKKWKLEVQSPVEVKVESMQ